MKNGNLYWKKNHLKTTNTFISVKIKRTDKKVKIMSSVRVQLD